MDKGTEERKKKFADLVRTAADGLVPQVQKGGREELGRRRGGGVEREEGDAIEH